MKSYKGEYTKVKKFFKIKKYFGILITIALLCTACKKRENAFLEEDFQELNEENQQIQEEEEIENTRELERSQENDKKKPQEESNEVCVYVCGAVQTPGLYYLENGKRIGDAVKMAGGMNEDASVDSLNQAELLSDGQMIKVLTLEECEYQKQENTDEETGENSGRVNLNTGTLEQLMTLPGIGQSKAESIVSYREEHGKFSSVEEIMNITGIKEGIYNKIKDYISVD